MDEPTYSEQISITGSITVHYRLDRPTGLWIAICRTCDLYSIGKTREEAKERIRDLGNSWAQKIFKDK